jgi:hypothetical protein
MFEIPAFVEEAKTVDKKIADLMKSKFTKILNLQKQISSLSMELSHEIIEFLSKADRCGSTISSEINKIVGKLSDYAKESGKQVNSFIRLKDWKEKYSHFGLNSSYELSKLLKNVVRTPKM